MTLILNGVVILTLYKTIQNVHDTHNGYADNHYQVDLLVGTKMDRTQATRYNATQSIEVVFSKDSNYWNGTMCNAPSSKACDLKCTIPKDANSCQAYIPDDCKYDNEPWMLPKVCNNRIQPNYIPKGHMLYTTH